MQIYKINYLDNNQVSFSARQNKPFMLPVKYIQTRYWKRKVDDARIYDNPNAELLYQKALQTKDLREKTGILDQMGSYHLVANEKKEGLLRKIIKIFIKS